MASDTASKQLAERLLAVLINKINPSMLKMFPEHPFYRLHFP